MMTAYEAKMLDSGNKVYNNIEEAYNDVQYSRDLRSNYCFKGIDTDSIIAIGTVGGSPRKYIDRLRFEEGLAELVRVLRPHTIVVYGSANYPCFKKLKEQGIKIIAFSSETARAFERRKSD